ncbi:MAG: ATP-dependent helicase, partial [Chlorobium sp.]
MIPLHLSILDGNPILWSEGKKIGMLKELRLATAGIGISPLRSNTTKEFCVWLPCHGEKPFPSSPLVGTAPDISEKESLQPFPITALRLNSNTLFELSLLTEKGNIPVNGIVFGNSLLWMRQVLKIALDIIRNQSLLPSLVKNNTFWDAQWLPFPDNTTFLALDKLAETMPAVCRALSKPDA